MSRVHRVIVVILLICAVGGVFALRAGKRTADMPPSVAGEPDLVVASPDDAVPVKLPRLVDLGADKCVPCKMMAPVLEELERDFDGVFEVEFIDVWKSPEAGEPYGVRIIPTQIFFDGGGKELFRHEGFFSREDILAKWKELGHDMQAEGS